MRLAQVAPRGVVLLVASLVAADATAAVFCRHVDTETSSGARFVASGEQLRDGAARAELSEAVYGCLDACREVNGRWGEWRVLLDSRTWYRMRTADLREMIRRVEPNRTEPAIQPIDPSGFHGAAFELADGSALIIAFEGTSSLLAMQDWATNVGMTFWKPQQFEDAEEFTSAVLDRYCGTDASCHDRITVTGHSLGGALAQHVGLKYGLRTYTFNAAGLFRPSRAELAAASLLRYQGMHFFSQAYRLGSEYGVDVVPYLGDQFAQETCEVPVQLPALSWDALTAGLLTHEMQRLAESLSSEAERLLARTGNGPTTLSTAVTSAPPISSRPAIGAPSAGSTGAVIGSVAPAAPTVPPPSGGSVPTLLAELGALTGNARYASFSDALANAHVPARLSVQATADICRGMNEYNEPCIRLIAGRIVGPLTAVQVDRLAADSQGLARFKIVSYLAGLLPGPLHPVDIDLIVRNMELYRAPMISMLAPRLASNMGAREVIALFGSMSSPIRLATLSELKSARKLKSPMSPAEVNAIAVTFGFLLEGTAREVLQQP